MISFRFLVLFAGVVATTWAFVIVPRWTTPFVRLAAVEEEECYAMDMERARDCAADAIDCSLEELESFKDGTFACARNLHRVIISPRKKACHTGFHAARTPRQSHSPLLSASSLCLFLTCYLSFFSTTHDPR